MRVPGPFYLQPHVFLCRGRRHWVILDVHRDKYLCVDRRQFEALGPLLQGWEGTSIATGPDANGREAVPPDAIALANQLLDLDLLSERAAHAKDARPTDYSLPNEGFDLDSPAPSRRSSVLHAGPFFLSSAQASRQLREQRFQATVEFVQARKHRQSGRSGSFDLERARSLVSVFERWRLFFPRPYLCLFDSLALIHFLARFHLYPDWVFAVNADPFEAHCWVQAGGVVLNDRVERVSGFTPIMYV